MQCIGQCKVSTSLLQANNTTLDQTGLVQASYKYADNIAGLAQAKITLQAFQSFRQACKPPY